MNQLRVVTLVRRATGVVIMGVLVGLSFPCAAAPSDAPTTSPALVATDYQVPERYRTMPAAEIRREMARLEAAANHLPRGSADLRNMEMLIESLEVRLRTGILPQDLVADITSNVARLRGLPVHRPIQFRILDREALRAYVNRLLDEELPPEYLPNFEFVLKLMGAIPQRTDLRKTIVGLLGEQVAGLYDRKTRTLFILKTFDLNRALGKIILAHEICHALQDQNYNLSAMPLNAPGNDDVSLAVSSVLEGDATLLMSDFARDSLTGRDLLTLVDVFSVDQAALNRAPEFLRQQLMFPYLSGANFMQMVGFADPGNRDRAFRELPRSTEQIIHPEKFYTGDRDEPTSFSLPDLAPILGSGWKRAMTNVMGEFQIRTLFEAWRQWDEGTRVSEGWGGDRYALYRRGDSYLFAWASAWDTEDDAQEFFTGLSNLLRSKRFRDDFNGEDYDDKPGLRAFSSGGEKSDLGIYLRFVRTRNSVVVLLSNSRSAYARAGEIEGLLMSAVRAAAKPAAPGPSGRGNGR